MQEEEKIQEDQSDEEVPPAWSTKPTEEWEDNDVIDWCKYNGFLSVLSRFAGKLYIYITHSYPNKLNTFHFKML